MGSKKLSQRRKVVMITIMTMLILAVTAVTLIMLPEYRYRSQMAVIKDGNIKIYPLMTLVEVADELQNEGLIKDARTMTRSANAHDIVTVEPGNYDLTKGTSYRTLLATLSQGRQTPIRLIFNNFRTADRLLGAVGRRLLADSTALTQALFDPTLISSEGFTPATLLTMFIPNTYEVYWTITPDQFFEKMHGEYLKFWTAERRAKAKKLDLTPMQVSIIASIVEAETQKVDEMTNVAGVYINRIRKGMKLQADPTVKFALQDFGIKRLLFRHLEADSPYNTYRYAGLPPGPICQASIAAIDATLNYSGHRYIYFCAKSDFSGYHAFATTLDEHNRNAREYQNELNRRKIK